ncbi:MAG: universal stress protein, partial [Gemmatimonadales bacterium]
RVRSDVRLGEDGRIVGEDETQDEKLAGSSGRQYDLVAMGAHGIGQQPHSQLGGVVSRSARSITKDMLIVKNERPLRSGKIMVCVDGSSYSYKAMRVGLELAQTYGATLYLCSAFDVEYHHAVFNNIKDVLSVKAGKVFKFEEQEELHNNIIDKGLLKLSQTHIRRAEVMAQEFPDVPVQSQILVGKPFQVILQWVEEIEPTLLIIGRHGGHRIEGTEMGSQTENLIRMAPANVLVTGIEGITPEDIPWLEEDGEAGLPWAPDAEVRIQRVPPFAQGIARRAVEEYTIEQGGATVTNHWLDQAIQKLLPTHMQLIMGVGDAEELARAEVKAEEQMAKTLVLGRDDDAEPAGATVEVACPETPHTTTRPRSVEDPPVWTEEGFDRLKVVPLIARPLARMTVERFAKGQGIWRITTAVMDENKQAMIEADEFDAETMMGMFRELRAKQIKAEAQGGDALSPEMRKFIEEAKASGMTRCPIRDIEEQMSECPVDFKTVSPKEAKAAVEELMKQGEGSR